MEEIIKRLTILSELTAINDLLGVDMQEEQESWGELTVF